METVTLDMYNPHALVTLKKIINTESGDAQFELYKTTEQSTRTMFYVICAQS